MTVSLEGIQLPEDIQWINEFRGHGVGQQQTPTLTGAILVEETAQTNGRSITLSSNGHAWAARAVVDQLESLASTPLESGETLTLVWGDGRTFDVVFDHSSGSPIEADEVIRRAAIAQTTGHHYFLTIRLLTA